MTGIYNNKDNKKDTYALSEKDLTLTLKDSDSNTVEAVIVGTTGVPVVSDSITSVTGLSYTVVNSALTDGTAYTLELKDTLGNTYPITTGGSVTRSGSDPQTNNITATKRYAAEVPISITADVYTTLADTLYIVGIRAGAKGKSFSFNKSELTLNEAGTAYTGTVYGINFEAHDTDGANDNYGRVILSSSASSSDRIDSDAQADQNIMDSSKLPTIRYKTLTIDAK